LVRKPSFPVKGNSRKPGTALAKACGYLSGEVEEDAFPLKFAQEEQFLAVFGGKNLEGKLFTGEPVHGEGEAIFFVIDAEVTWFFLQQRNQKMDGEMDGVAGRLL